MSPRDVLPLVFLADGLVNHVSFLFEDIDAAEEIVEFEVGARLLALIIQSAVLIVLF